MGPGKILFTVDKKESPYRVWIEHKPECGSCHKRSCKTCVFAIEAIPEAIEKIPKHLKIYFAIMARNTEIYRSEYTKGPA